MQEWSYLVNEHFCRQNRVCDVARNETVVGLLKGDRVGYLAEQHAWIVPNSGETARKMHRAVS